MNYQHMIHQAHVSSVQAGQKPEQFQKEFRAAKKALAPENRKAFTWRGFLDGKFGTGTAVRDTVRGEF